MLPEFIGCLGRLMCRMQIHACHSLPIPLNRINVSLILLRRLPQPFLQLLAHHLALVDLLLLFFE